MVNLCKLWVYDEPKFTAALTNTLIGPNLVILPILIRPGIGGPSPDIR
jgi:hypothetical protein